MSKRGKTRYRYAIGFLVSFALSLSLLFLRGYFAIGDTALRYKALSDAFCVVGSALVMIGVLFRIEREGVFDTLSFALARLLRGLTFSGGCAPLSFQDYRRRKREERESGSVKLYFALGGVFVALAIFFTVLFYAT